MKRTRSAAALSVLSLLAVTALAGDLNPPPGPIAPTMKSLDAVEPRVCINELPGSMTATHAITEPGNYYCTADIVGEPGKHGIEIGLSTDGGVTIDLNGFSLIGVPGSLDAVHGRDLGGHQEWIQLGNINQGWSIGHQGAGGGGGGINGWGDNGVDSDGIDEVRVSGIGIRDCGGHGVLIKNANRSLVDKAYVDNQAGNGILIEDSVETRLTSTSVSNSGGNGITVRSGIAYCTLSMSNSTTTGNGGSGIEADFTGASGGQFTLGGSSTLNNALHGLHIQGAGLTPAAGQETITIQIGYSEDYLNASHNGGDGVNIEFDNSIAPMIAFDNANCNDNALDGINVSALSPTTRSHTRIRRGAQNYNGGNGITVTGNLEINGATIGNNGGHGVEFFETGDIPTEQQFGNLIDSIIHFNEDDGVNGTDSDLTIRGCNVSNNSGDGIDYANNDPSTSVIQIVDIKGESNGGAGLKLLWEQLSGPRSMSIADSSFSHNTLEGLRMNHVGEEIYTDEYARVKVLFNGGGGVVITDSDPSSAMLKKKRIRKKQCTAHGNVGPGFSVQAPITEFIECFASHNTADGFGVAGETFVLDGCHSTNNEGNGVRISGGGGGACGTATLTNCITNNNTDDGINLACTSGGTIRQCESSKNGGRGVFIGGIAGHVVIENIASGNTLGGYSIPTPGNSVGPIVDELGLAANTNPYANLIR